MMMSWCRADLDPEKINFHIFSCQESAEIVRSFVGGLELVTNLLKSNNREVRTRVRLFES